MMPPDPCAPIDVIVDSTVVRQGAQILSGPNWRYLRAFAARTGGSLLIPRVVVLETERYVEDETRKAYGLARQGAGIAARFGLSTPRAASPAAEDRAVRAALAETGRRMGHLTILPLPDVEHEAVIARLNEGAKPFRGDPHREVGYRDYLIWETILAHGDSKPGVSVAFLTGNTKDFGTTAAGLHPNLKAEAVAHGIDVRLFENLEQFIDKVVGQCLPPLGSPLAMLEEPETREALTGFIETELSDGRGNEIGREAHAFLGGIAEDLTLTYLEGFEIDTLDGLVELGEQEFGAEVFGTGQGTLGFFVYKADAYAFDDESISLQDWNEHYFAGEVVVNVECSVRVELRLTDETLEPVSLEVMEITIIDSRY